MTRVGLFSLACCALAYALEWDRGVRVLSGSAPGAPVEAALGLGFAGLWFGAALLGVPLTLTGLLVRLGRR